MCVNEIILHEIINMDAKDTSRYLIYIYSALCVSTLYQLTRRSLWRYPVTYCSLSSALLFVSRLCCTHRWPKNIHPVLWFNTMTKNQHNNTTVTVSILLSDSGQVLAMCTAVSMHTHNESLYSVILNIKVTKRSLQMNQTRPERTIPFLLRW